MQKAKNMIKWLRQILTQLQVILGEDFGPFSELDGLKTIPSLLLQDPRERVPSKIEAGFF
jgi:hypothetical protein